MKALNFAILKHFIGIAEACASDVETALKPQYAAFKALNKKSIVDTLMTAEANGLLEESRFVMDANDELTVYYRANKKGAETINRYIKD